MKNEMSRRQFLGFAGSAAAVLGLGLVGCGGSAGSGSSASGDAAEVYFLQFKPEVDKEWKEIAKAYKKEKGVEVKIVTAASNTYEEKLKSEMSKSSAPTLFQVNGPTGLKNWKDYCADLSDTKLRGELIDDSLALQSDGKDLGIDWVQESYGIIYNKELLEKAGYKAEDINSFDKLKACADDIQARKDELGVDGAFTSAGMDDSSSWRYTRTSPTSRSTTSSRRSTIRRTTRSRASISTTLSRSSTCISPTPPAILRSSPPRPVTTPPTSSQPARPSSTRTALGPTPTSPRPV